MPSLLVLAGSQSCYRYLNKSLQCLPVPGSAGTQNTVCRVFDSANFILSGKKVLKHYVGSESIDISLMPEDKQYWTDCFTRTVLCCKT